MGWRIIYVDRNGRLRNGGVSFLEDGSDVEAEARIRAAKHNTLVASRGGKVMNVVCVKVD
jgi:hypothetical protein